MRALIVVLALVATPFLAGVSQSLQGSNCENGLGDDHRSLQGQLHAHKGLCATQLAPPYADGDGVRDSLGDCGGTALGAAVGASGVSVDPSPGCVNAVDTVG